MFSRCQAYLISSKSLNIHPIIPAATGSSHLPAAPTLLSSLPHRSVILDIWNSAIIHSSDKTAVLSIIPINQILVDSHLHELFLLSREATFSAARTDTEVAQVHSSAPSAVMTNHLQTWNIQPKSTDRRLQPPGAEHIKERAISCIHPAAKPPCLEKTSTGGTAARCLSATAGEFLWAGGQSSRVSSVGFPILRPRETNNWDEGCGEERWATIFCSQRLFFFFSFDKHNLTKT